MKFGVFDHLDRGCVPLGDTQRVPVGGGAAHQAAALRPRFVAQPALA